jgi:hypothetical protein
LHLGVSLPVMQFRGKAVLVYHQTQTDGRKVLQTFRAENMKLQQAKTYSGRLTVGAKKRLTKAITLMVQGTRRQWIVNPVTKKTQLHQLSFMTLTVSDHTKKLTGREAYQQLLSGFLQWLRKSKKVTTYIWKAELHKDGQIHYHITLPDFIHYREIRDKWNDLQKRAGLLDRYHEEHGHWDPNSTDIHKVYKIKDVTSYLVKEIAKSMQNDVSLGGKVWDCSLNLSNGKYFSVYMRQEHELFLNTAVNEGLAEIYVADQFSLYRFEKPVEEYILTRTELKHYRSWLTVLQESIYNTDPPPPETNSGTIQLPMAAAGAGAGGQVCTTNKKPQTSFEFQGSEMNFNSSLSTQI